MSASTTTRRRIGVLGGTFDPPHIGHLIIATELRHALDLDLVLFVPAGQPPHKQSFPVTAERHRLAMVQRAIADDPFFALSTVDSDRVGPSYTADLLEILSQSLAPVSLVFLMGEDSLRDIPTWHDPSRIVALAELGVAARPGTPVALDAIYAAVPAAQGRIIQVATPEIAISSRDLRQRVATGVPITYQVPAQVEQYIIREGLYR